MLCVQGEEANKGVALRVVRAGRALARRVLPVAVAAVGAPRARAAGQGPVVRELAIISIAALISEEVAADHGLGVLAREVPRHLPLRRLLEPDPGLGEVPLVFFVLLPAFGPHGEELLLARRLVGRVLAPVRVLVEASSAASTAAAALGASLIPTLVEGVLVRRRL